LHVRRSVFGTAERPRLAVSRSINNIGCQIIDDARAVTLVSASTLADAQLKKSGGNVAAAAKIGSAIAEKAKGLGIKKVVFDRRWYKFHGRVKALAEAARKGGLEF
jgi:large subunit ribosomal protein L18